MLETPMARRGMVAAPHHLAAQAGLAVLREGGNAIEAAVAASATLAAVQPHLSGLGGDAFWLIAEPGKPPVSIDGSGAAGGKVEPGLYRESRLDRVPVRGPLSAATVAGLVSSWQLALDVSAHWGGRLPLARLFEDAIHHARTGVAVTRLQAAATAAVLAELKGVAGFADTFLAKRKAPPAGAIATLPALAATFERLAAAGLDDFYRGEVGRTLAAGLQAAGSPLRADDLARHRGMRRRPLSLGLPSGTVFNTAPPTQGLAALVVLGLFQRLDVREAGGAEHVHGLAEAARVAFRIRDAHIADPGRMSVHATTYLSEHVLDRMAAEIDRTRAGTGFGIPRDGESAWLGVVDGQGRAVSVAQGLYRPFGSGVVVRDAGVLWHDRAAAFTLDGSDRNMLEPRRRPFHTLAPGLARLKDGRTMVWGASGGDAQAQAQAQLFTRAALFGEPLQAAASAPRWLLGPDGLMVEARLDPGVVGQLAAAGHRIEVAAPWDPRMGVAGALARHGDGVVEGAADPRGDGSVAAF
ncbi:MAG: gamma-glutamyltransferase family protein [Actinomycetota bacterium]